MVLHHKTLLQSLWLTGLIIFSLSCVKRPVHTDVLIPVACVSAPIDLVDCDDANPPKCKRSIIRYKKGCEFVAPHKAQGK